MSRLFYDRPVDAYHNRTSRTQFSLRAANGRDAAQLAADQTVRFKVGKSGEEPLLDLTEEPNDAKSVIEILDRGNPSTKTAATLLLVIGEADLDPEAMEAGEYEGELILVEPETASPPFASRSLGRGRIVVHPSQGGSLGTS